MKPHRSSRVPGSLLALALAVVLSGSAFSSSALAQPPAIDAQAATAAAQAGGYEAAYRLWRPLADKGDAVAQYRLGLMYSTGRGVAHDDAQAVGWFRKAANQGMADALSPVIAQGWSLATAYALLAWFVFAPQCLSTLAVVRRETNSWRSAS